MMYIEHTPLEENLLYILGNHDPSSAASSILAHIRGAAGADTNHLQLREEEQEESSAYRRSAGGAHYDVLGGNNTSGAKSDKIIKSASEKELPALTRKRRKRSTPVIDVVSDEEEEERFELLDIVDIEDGYDENVNLAGKLNGEAEVQGKDRNSNSLAAETNKEIVIEIEEDGEDIEYIVSKVPKRSKPGPPPLKRRAFPKPKSADNWEVGQSSRARRPVPDAIPIRSLVSQSQSTPQFRQRKDIAPVRLLNGKASHWKRCASQDIDTSSCSSDSDDCSDHYSIVNGWHPEEVEIADEELLIRDTNQMGFDILNKIKRLLNLDTYSIDDTHVGSRKRRSENHLSEAPNPRQIKYRKVENRFPKIITHPLEDDHLQMTSNIYPKRGKEKFSVLPCSSRNSVDLTQQSSVYSMDKPKQRKSIFVAPTVTHKIVKNTSYADVEFSDDDEPELIGRFDVGASGGGPYEGAVKKAPKVFNIPIMHEEQNKLFSKPHPPPLIEARTGSILASSLMPNFESSRKPTTYADVLRQNMPMSSMGAHVLGGRGASAFSSSGASTSASFDGINGFNNMRSSLWSTNARSILAQEKETEEREKYQQLLEQVVPRLYGVPNDNKQNELTQSSDTLQRRASASSNAGGLKTQNSLNISRQPLATQNTWQHSLKRPPLSSTINLDDDDDNDVTLTGVTQLKSRSVNNRRLPTVIIDDDDDEISEIIDLDDDERTVLSACAKLKQDSGIDSTSNKDIKKSDALPFVEPVNSLKERFKTSPHLQDNWLQSMQLKWLERKKNRTEAVKETVSEVEKLAAERRVAELQIQERLRKFQIVDPDLLVIDDFPEPVIEEEPEYFELNVDQQARIKAAICGPPDQVLVSKFNLNITRRDIHTLLGHNWLNDEVINFYMNLLTERGEKKHDSHGLPRVYAMNTFFIPRLLQAGHGGVKRWTRKVDIFGMDVIPVPVHVGGVHWCMAIIHLKNRTIKYYDSMGTPNPNVLRALEQYLKDESMDKRKQPYDTSQFEIESVRDVPRQMNGSDCGVFSCMFAEYISRNREITFSQQHMEYFRHKMILEIVQGELLY